MPVEPDSPRASIQAGPFELQPLSARLDVPTANFFETPVEIYRRVFRTLRPRTPLPEIRIEYRPLANANSSISLEDGFLRVKLSDLLRDAPQAAVEALAFILISKLFRRPVPDGFQARYRAFLNRREMRVRMEQARQERGRKYISGPAGEHHHLEEIFEDLNRRFFNGLMARPELGWSRAASRVHLGHYDPSHHAIVLTRALDRPEVPPFVVEYIMFHEMLHLRHPVEVRRGRRCVHTPEFKADERGFPQLAEAKLFLKQFCS